MSKRIAISKRIRFEVFKRDGFTCQYCGNHPPDILLHVDHIVAVSKGGRNDIDNLVASCEACNLGKGARSLAAVPQSLKDKAGETAEREAQILGYQEVMEGRRQRIDAECWRVADIWVSRYAQEGIRRDYFQSIKRFIERIGLDICLDAMEKAISKCYYEKAAFRYFCGYCWRVIRERENG